MLCGFMMKKAVGVEYKFRNEGVTGKMFREKILKGKREKMRFYT